MTSFGSSGYDSTLILRHCHGVEWLLKLENAVGSRSRANTAIQYFSTWEVVLKHLIYRQYMALSLSQS
jgi:hypothetical protein